MFAEGSSAAQHGRYNDSCDEPQSPQLIAREQTNYKPASLLRYLDLPKKL